MRSGSVELQSNVEQMSSNQMWSAALSTRMPSSGASVYLIWSGNAPFGGALRHLKMTTPFNHQKSVTPSNTSNTPTIEGTFTHDSIPLDVDMLDDESEDLDKGEKNSS
ncbi:hypothetical protein LWI29_019872 [Acer saccharum]|uniref:Uncharacterized protein n=1 Tax=Acer saccharum TaxID=4024 RepID=A0AA39TGM6_ACESA|nr:hypothetical protein LWI29_019872 [Acer saccharum]